MISASEALQRLREGNASFVSGEPIRYKAESQTYRSNLVDRQEPFAVILGCSDSRVPVEIIFDQGIGDLFVIRVAGNIIAPSQMASVEFAAQRLDTPLVVVLGHTGCGAVTATVEELLKPSEQQSQYWDSIVDRIRPSVEGLLATESVDDPDALAMLAIRANIKESVRNLQHESNILERLIRGNATHIVGAEYSLETGEVDFFENLPASG